MLAETLAPVPSENPSFLNQDAGHGEATPASDVGGEFREKVAAHEAQRAAAKQLRADMVEAEAAAFAAAPPPAILLDTKGRVTFWAESTIRDDRVLTIEQKADALAAFREWQPKFDAAYEAKAGVSRTDHGDSDDEAMDHLWDAAEEVLQARPTSLSDLLHQIRLTIELSHEDFREYDVDDPAMLSRLLSGGLEEGRGLALIYRNVSLLAGQHKPILDAAPWNAEDWVQDFESNPGHHVNEFGPYFTNAALERGSIPGRGAWDRLRQWQQKEVLLYHNDRVNEGARQWIADWCACGGRFGTMMGAPVFEGSEDPANRSERERLEKLLDVNGLRVQVVKMLRGIFA